MAARLGTAWTAAEDELIRQHDHLTRVQVAAMLPGRSVEAVGRRRLRLGLEAKRVACKSDEPVPPLTDSEMAEARAFMCGLIRLAQIAPGRVDVWRYMSAWRKGTIGWDHLEMEAV